MKAFSFVKSIIFSFVLLSVIIFSCDKKSIIEDDLDVCIKSFELLNSENDQKNLGSDIKCDIDTENYTISLTVPSSAELTGLKFNITPCEGTTISPASGEEVDFEEVVGEPIERETATYDVSEESAKEHSPQQRYKKVFALTKGDKSQDYTVYIIRPLASADNRISAFEFKKETGVNDGLKLTRSSADESRTSDVIINHEDGTIKVKVSTAADVTALTPTITKHASATISPAEGVHNYATPKIYTITAQDGQTKEYTVSVAKDLSNDKIITSFKFEHTQNPDKSFNNVDYSAASIDSSGNGDGAVTITKIPNTVLSLTGLKPTIVISANASVNPENQAPNGFTRGTPAVYTVTAQDGTTRNYNVTIPTLQAVTEITSFKILKTDHQSNSKISTDMTISPTNSGSDYTIVLDGEDQNTVSLSPEIVVSRGATVNPGSKEQKEFTYGTPVTYTVTAENGTAKSYSVTVKSSNSKMKSFKFKSATGNNSSAGKIVKDVSGTISGNTITVNVPHDAELNGLTPDIELYNGANVSPEATTAQDFSSQKTYTVTAQDGSTSIYTVTIQKNTEPEIQSFTFTDSNNAGKNIGNNIGVEVKHSEGEIIVKVPYNTDLTVLTPTVTANSSALAGTQVYKGESGTTEANTSSADFSNSHTTAVKYSAVGPAGGRKVYNVKVYKAPAITEFKFEKSANSDAGFPTGQTYTGTPNQGSSFSANGTIAVTVANTVDVANLKATISGDNFTTLSNHNISFSGSSSYSTTITVQNEHLSSFTKTYTVNLTKEAAPKLTEFKISADTNKGIQSEITGDITDDDSNSAAATGTIKLKFDHKVSNRNTEINLDGLTYTSQPGTGHALTPASPVNGSIHNQQFTLTTTLGSKRVYTVTAVKGPFIKSFTFTDSSNNGKNLGANVDGKIDHAAGTITLEVPSGVTMDAGASANTVTLTPTIELGGDSVTIDPASATAQAFTPDGSTAIQYTVTNSSDTTFTKVYQVTVSKK
ncbi:DUF5018 domain-containing protein [Ichthyobacterium seriolicida]|uniref:Pkd domain containing protein n=1 Tax=Ichthyobacterium seriolicida TaxID=242600 RepID=A0A1J1E180_9FLAO|nr:hypothetical protein [Ichthyobacterium seriolicida]BAV94701.1 pkd domain containing protein [Ichthyobacterium seriolicida]